MRLHEVRQTRVPMEEAFDYTADFANIARWDPGVVASQRHEEGEVGLGSTFDVQVEFGSKVSPMVYEITEFDRPHRVVLTGRGRRLVAVDDIRFSSEGDVTVIDYTADLDFRGMLAVIAPLVAGRIRRVGERALDGLAAVLDR